jgi:hypothetical protein
MKKIKNKQKMLKRAKKMTKKNLNHKRHRENVVFAERQKVIKIKKVISRLNLK